MSENEPLLRLYEMSLAHSADIYNLTPDCVKLLAMDGRLLQMNAAGLRMIEADDFEQVKNQSMLSLVVADDQHAFNELSKKVFAGSTGSLEFQIVGLRGTRRWLETSAKPVKDANGTVQALLGITRDITERKAAEYALMKSEQGFRVLSESIPQQVWTAEPDGALNYVNSRVTEYFGLLSEVILGDGWKDLVHPDDLPVAIQRWTGSLASGNPYQIDFRLRRHDGLYLWHIGMALPMRDKDGKIARWFGTNTDISARKEAEESIVELAFNLAAAQERAKLGSWRRDLVSNVAEWSAEMYRLFGCDPELEPPPFTEVVKLVHHDDRAIFVRKHNAHLKRGKSYQLDFRLPKKNGDYLWIEARSETIRDNLGRAIVLTGTAQDITARKHAELALMSSETRFGAFIEQSPALAFIKNESGQFVYVNPTLLETFQLVSKDIIGKTVFDVWPEHVAQRLHAHDSVIFSTNTRTEAFEDVPTPTGMRHWFSVKFIFANAEGVRFLGGTAIDLTDRFRAEQALITSSRILASSQAIAKLGGWEFDLQSKKVYFTDEIYRLHDANPQVSAPDVKFGVSYFLPESKDTIIAALDKAVRFGEAFDLELQSMTLKGRIIDVRVTCSAVINDGVITKLTGIFQDISEQKAAQLALETVNHELARANDVLGHIAHYDTLTNLPNRALLADRMQQAMLHTQRRDQCIAIAFLDLDGFKVINDKHGHSVGDDLLVAIAQRMKSLLREGDTFARIGGDEFVAVLTDLQDPKECKPLLERLLEAASMPVILGERALHVSASIGVTIFPQDCVDAEQLLRHADQAMYLAKQAGKNCFHLFDVENDAALKHQRAELGHLRRALENREFVLYYQPKVNMRNGAVIGMEALIRWQHPERGLLLPAAFLPKVENDAISIEIGEWVITTALTQITQWQEQGIDLSVSVNVGALQLQQDFAIRLEQILAQFLPCSAQHLELEILETSALEDINQVSATITECQKFGVRFALDDFGTGYSSLSYLKRLPTASLKIDQSFVHGMIDDPDDLAIIKGIVGLAAAFRREVIAEGVESLAHGKMLLLIGCELAQGYGIARPMPALAVSEWMERWRIAPVWIET